MKKYEFVLYIVVALLVICFCNKHENKEWIHNLNEEIENERDSLKRVEEKQNALDSIRHLEIQDSLKVVDGKRVIGDIYFGMTQKQYNLSKDKLLSKCGGTITIENCKFDITRAYFDLDELYGVRLHSHCVKADWFKIVEIFKKKYGAPTYNGAGPNQYPMTDRYIKQWLFDYKLIEVRYDSNAHGNDLLNNGSVIIEILNPAILDRISNRNQEEQEKKKKIEDANKNTSETYFEQL